ncbi:MAG: glycosyltransferase family 4 protein [Bacteroidales bacterium]
MKVGIILPSNKYAGPGKVIESLLTELISFNDIEVDLYLLKELHENIIRFPVTARIFNRKSIHFENYDVIHTNGILPDLIAFCFKKRIRYHVSTIHNYVFEDLKYRYNVFISFVLGHIWLYFWKRANTLVCVSDSINKYYKQWISANRLLTIHNGISTQSDSKIYDENIVRKSEEFKVKGLKVIGCITELTRIKGLEQLLHLIYREGKLALLLIGAGKDEERLQKTANKLGIEERCYFTGFKPDGDIYNAFFDIYIMPSMNEGFGLSMMEAVSKKVPLVCSDIPIFRELFSDEEVFFFKLGDIQSLKDSANLALESGNQKAEKAYRRYLESYTGRLMAERYYSLYCSVS